MKRTFHKNGGVQFPKAKGGDRDSNRTAVTIIHSIQNEIKDTVLISLYDEIKNIGNPKYRGN